MQNTAHWTARRSYVVLAFILIVIALLLAGCASLNRGEEQTGRGAVTVPSVGSVARSAVGDDNGSTTRGAIFSAVIGGAPGTIIGRQMDQQAKEIEQHVAGATVERVGEGIQLTFASALLFDANADQLRPEVEQSLRNLATTFDRYRDTDLLIVGRTDSVNGSGSNRALSERRARSVSDFLVRQGVPVGRLHSAAQAETPPYANQRVEVAIFASHSYRDELTRDQRTR